MRAYIIPEFGAPGDIAEVPMPEPGEGEILVRVHAAAVNAMEPFIAAGYAKDYFEHRFPLRARRRYAGTVSAIGPGVPGFEVGDEVFGDVGKAAVRARAPMASTWPRRRGARSIAPRRCPWRSPRPCLGRAARPSRRSTQRPSNRATR